MGAIILVIVCESSSIIEKKGFSLATTIEFDEVCWIIKFDENDRYFWWVIVGYDG